jgi:Cna protein B-type domain.
MKKILPLLAFILMVSSCLKEPSLVSYSLDLKVDFGTSLQLANKSGAIVTLTSQQKNYKVSARTDESGKIQFQSLDPGIYSVVVSYSSTSGEYSGQASISVFSNMTDTVALKKGVFGALIIKEFYFSGSRTPAGKSYYADQYIEIYNNTDEVRYADGISVFEHESSGTGVNMWESIKDTIVGQMIWTIPGNGKQYPVQPGKSIIIAQDGINHRDDPNGNPLSPVNLGNADFEFYVATKNNKDVDSPTAANMVDDYLSNTNISEIAFRVQGGSALIIAKLPGNSEAERKAYIAKNLVAKEFASGSSTIYYPKIANKYVIDAVETVEDEAHATYKRLPADIDAGYTYIISGSYSGKCVRRKVKEIVSGRVVYQDTNNSTNDFLKDVDPMPKIYE